MPTAAEAQGYLLFLALPLDVCLSESIGRGACASSTSLRCIDITYTTFFDSVYLDAFYRQPQDAGKQYGGVKIRTACLPAQTVTLKNGLTS